MENIISLLIDKNEHLQRFYNLNETELAKFVEGNFDTLETFYNSREAILDLVRCLDRLIEHSQLQAGEDLNITDSDRIRVKATLDAKNHLVTRILAQDLQILSVLESAKSNIIKELAQTKSTRKAVSSYKSGLTRSQLNEEV